MRYHQVKNQIKRYEKIFGASTELNGAIANKINRQKLLNTINYAIKNGFTYKTNSKNGVELWFDNTPHEKYPAVEVYISNDGIFQICDDTLHGTLLGLHEFLQEYEMEMRGM